MTNEVVREEKQELPHIRPAADVLQQNDSYYIVVDLPGVSKENLDISVDENVLTVQADASFSFPEKERILENEFGNARYIRKFTLSNAVDKDSINANIKNGVLHIHLPKAKELQPKRIEIQEG